MQPDMRLQKNHQICNLPSTQDLYWSRVRKRAGLVNSPQTSHTPDTICLDPSPPDGVSELCTPKAPGTKTDSSPKLSLWPTLDQSQSMKPQTWQLQNQRKRWTVPFFFLHIFMLCVCLPFPYRWEYTSPKPNAYVPLILDKYSGFRFWRVYVWCAWWDGSCSICPAGRAT